MERGPRAPRHAEGRIARALRRRPVRLPRRARSLAATGRATRRSRSSSATSRPDDLFDVPARLASGPCASGGDGLGAMELLLPLLQRKGGTVSQRPPDHARRARDAPRREPRCSAWCPRASGGRGAPAPRGPPAPRRSKVGRPRGCEALREEILRRRGATTAAAVVLARGCADASRRTCRTASFAPRRDRQGAARPPTPSASSPRATAARRPAPTRPDAGAALSSARARLARAVRGGRRRLRSILDTARAEEARAQEGRFARHRGVLRPRALQPRRDAREAERSRRGRPRVQRVEAAASARPASRRSSARASRCARTPRGSREDPPEASLVKEPGRIGVSSTSPSAAPRRARARGRRVSRPWRLSRRRAGSRGRGRRAPLLARPRRGGVGRRGGRAPGLRGHPRVAAVDRGRRLAKERMVALPRRRAPRS